MRRFNKKRVGKQAVLEAASWSAMVGQRRCRRGRPVLPGGLVSCAQGLLTVTLERGNEENIAR